MIEIIPAIDLIDGKAVRLKQGDYAQKTVYRENPLEVAKEFEAMGIRRLHLVDLDGAKAGKLVNLPVLEKIASQTGLIIDFGGGVKKAQDFKNILNAGARYVVVGSMAVKQADNFQECLDAFGADRIMLGVDVKDYKLAVSGWQESTNIDVFDFLNEKSIQGIKHVFSTDISKDGMLLGPSVELYRQIHQKFPDFNLIASGGIRNAEDVYAVEEAGCSGVIIGKAIYEGKIDLKNLLNE